MEPDCEACDAEHTATGGVVMLLPDNEWVWEFAQSIRTLGPEVAFALRGDLAIKAQDAHWLEMRLKLIINYLDSLDRMQEFEMLHLSMFAGMGAKKNG